MTTSRSTTPGQHDRLSADDRREALLDVAKELLVDGDPLAVTMGTVAEKAEVTRALVYKHFDNRDHMLAALYRREAAALDKAIRRTVVKAPEGLEPQLRAFIHSILEAVDTHGSFFASLRSFGGGASFRREQRSWDRRTLRHFTALAVRDLGVAEHDARVCLAVLLSGVTALFEWARAQPEPGARARLENTYVRMTIAALEGLHAPAQPRLDGTRD
jgi:AcrR family transcriptional regulator